MPADATETLGSAGVERRNAPPAGVEAWNADREGRNADREGLECRPNR